jgi:hypothetical protein
MVMYSRFSSIPPNDCGVTACPRRVRSPSSVTRTRTSSCVTSLIVGEEKANMLRCHAVALRTCTVSFTGPSGVRHSVEVIAESIYEAAALGISALKNGGWADAIAPGTELEIQVREPATCHRLTVQQIRRWCDGVAVSPDETLKKRRLKHLLA